MHLIYDLKKNSIAHTHSSWCGRSRCSWKAKCHSIIVIIPYEARICSFSCVCVCLCVDMGLACISFWKNNSKVKATRKKEPTHQLIRCVACMQFTFRIDKSCCFLSTQIQIYPFGCRVRALSLLRLSYHLESTLHAKCVCDFFISSFIRLKSFSLSLSSHNEEKTNIISTSPAAMSRKLYSFLMCAENFFVAWPIHARNAKNKNVFFLCSSGEHIRLSQRHRRHVISVGKFFYSPLVESKRKMAPSRVKCLLSWPEMQWEPRTQNHQPILSQRIENGLWIFRRYMFAIRLKAIPCTLSLTAVAMMMLLNFPVFRCCQAATMHHHHIGHERTRTLRVHTLTHTHTHIVLCYGRMRKCRIQRAHCY